MANTETAAKDFRPAISGSPRNLQTIAQVKPYSAPSGGSINNTVWQGVIIACPTPFSAVRVWFSGDVNGGSTRNVATLYVQPIEDPTATNPFVGTMSDSWASRGNGGNQLLTFNGAGADQEYPGTSGATTTLAIPAAAAGQGSIMLASDWYAIPNGAYPSKIGGATFDGYYYLGILVNPGAGGLIGYGQNVAGDLQAFLSSPLVTSSKAFHVAQVLTGNSGPAAFGTWSNFAPASRTAMMPFAQIDVMTSGRVMSVACLGDSQLGGWDNGGAGAPTSDLLGGVHRAVLAASTATLPLTYVNCARPGYDTPTWLQTFCLGLGNAITGSSAITSNPGGAGVQNPLIRPDVVFYQWASCNDNGFSPSRASIQDGFYRALDFGRYLQRQGIIPVICTVPPASGRYGTSVAYFKSAEGTRVFLNNQLRAMAAANPNFYVLDTDAIVSAGGSPATIIPAYAQGDGIHFTDAGNAAIAVSAQAILNAIISSG